MGKKAIPTFVIILSYDFSLKFSIDSLRDEREAKVNQLLQQFHPMFIHVL